LSPEAYQRRLGAANTSLTAAWRSVASAGPYDAVGTAAGGLVAPALFAALIATGSRSQVLTGYLLGAVLMLIAAVVAAFLALPAEGKSLEEISGTAMLEWRPGRTSMSGQVGRERHT